MGGIFPSGGGGDLTGAEIKARYEAEADTNAFTDAQVSKLTGIEVGATADQTGAEIKSLYEAEADTNAFTDAYVAQLTDHRKTLATAAGATFTVNGTTPTKVLSGPTLEASKAYSIDACIIYAAGTSVDGLISFQGPTGCQGSWAVIYAEDVTPLQISDTSSGNTFLVDGAGASTPQITFVRGFILTSTTSGDLDLFAAENVNGSTDFVLQPGTWISCTEVS